MCVTLFNVQPCTDLKKKTKSLIFLSYAKCRSSSLIICYGNGKYICNHLENSCYLVMGNNLVVLELSSYNKSFKTHS